MQGNVFFKTYGCAFNQLDSELMAGSLLKSGFKIVDTDKDANLILVNSCTVKNLSESKFFNDIKKYQNEGKKILVSGCITQAEESYLNTKLKGISVIGTNDLDQVVHVAKQALLDNPIQILSKLGRKVENEQKRLEKEKIRLLSPKLRNNKLVEIIPINEGCLNTCSFCKTKQARGQLFSYSIESIKKSMENALEAGANEIYLTSQDTGCYGFDIGTNLPALLRELLTIPGDYKIRIGMGNPNHFKKIIDEVLEIMKDDNRIYRFLHIPLQSANNRILDEMKRMYKYEDFREIVTKAKLAIPDITLANDIIVAYPTETEDEFMETVNSLKGTNVLNFSRFWLRPNTPAERMYDKKDFIEGSESKRRAKILKEEFERLAIINNKKWIRWSGECIITEVGKDGTNTFIARNDYYKPIVVKDNGNIKVGDKVNVRIDEVTWFDFRGEVIE